MKLPDNYSVINFFKKYGLSLLVVIIVLIFAKSIIINSYKQIKLAALPMCTIDNLEKIKNGTGAITYKGELFTVDTFDYQPWTYEPDEIRIDFQGITKDNIGNVSSDPCSNIPNPEAQKQCEDDQ